MLSFDNLEIGYQQYTTPELRRVYILFKLMSFAVIVKMGKLFLRTAIFLRIPISWLVKPTIFKQFCGGETLEEASKTIELLSKYKVKAILDYSVEGDSSDAAYQKALNETIATIHFAAKFKKNIPFAVFKPSAFGDRYLLTKASQKSLALNPTEQIELEQFTNRVDLLCKTAFSEDVPIMIDAEHYCYQQIVDEICEQMMEKYNKEKAIVFNTLQMYRTDRLEFLKKLLDIAQVKKFYLGIKFVRGAYMEKERARAALMNYLSPIHLTKEATDQDFDAAMEFSIRNIDKISIFCGTHNEKSSMWLTQLMDKFQIARNDSRVWFSQLYGMGNNISFNLANEGYNVAKYIPFGPLKHVLPYLIRRTEENTSVKGHTSRELLLISMELKRRGGLKNLN